MRLIVGVDMDGTIVEHMYPALGKPVPGAIEWMLKWQEAGCKIILWTMRSNEHLQEAVDYIESHGIKLFGINQNPTQSNWTTSPKAYCKIYVDDAAWGCPLIESTETTRLMVDWSELGPDILERCN